MEKLEQQIEQLALAVAKGFESVEQRFDQLEGRFDTFEEETRRNFRDVRHDIKELHDMSIPLPEQEELWRRLDRIEKHLGLSPELA